MSRVVFVNRFYWPDHTATAQLLTDLARGLSRQGRDVMVVASAPEGSAREELDGSVQVLRIRSTRGSTVSIARKAADFVTFFIGALWHMSRRLRKGDTLVVLTDPPLLAVPATLIAKLRGARIVHWIQDIYPEVAVAVTGQRLLNVFLPARNVAWRLADHCVALSGEMADVVRNAGVPGAQISLLPNWAPRGVVPLTKSDPRVLALRRAWALEGKFVVMYSGNLGRVHDIDTLILAAAALRGDSRVQFLVIGGGAQLKRLETEVERLRLPNVRCESQQSRDQLAVALAVGDAHVVSLRAGCERYVFPSKLHGIAAAGRAVLLIGPKGCEAARTVDEQGMGSSFANLDGEGLAARIRELSTNSQLITHQASESARYASRWTADKAIDAWVALLFRLQA